MVTLLDKHPRRIVAIAYSAMIDATALNEKAREELVMMLAWPEKREEYVAALDRRVAMKNAQALDALGGWAEPVG